MGQYQEEEVAVGQGGNVMMWRVLGVVLIIMIFLAAPVSAAGSVSVSSIGEKLVCQCGCTQTVAACSEPVCSTREAMRAMIGQKLGEGQSESQILQAFVGQYGEQVLVTPPKSGFNLVAWILPFVALVFGGYVIFLSLKKWVWQGKVQEVEKETMSEKEDEKYKLRLEKELKNFSEKGFR